jgi:hypothetical protein
MRRTACLTVCIVLAGCACSGAAYAKSFDLDGQFVAESPGVPTSVEPVEGHPTWIDVSFVGNTASLTGSWIGQNVTSLTARIDLETGATTGTFDETFTGSSERGGLGTILSTGTFTLGATNDDGTQAFRADARILSGTGDFEGSRGRVTYIGRLTAGVGSGTYSGRWILPARPAMPAARGG